MCAALRCKHEQIDGKRAKKILCLTSGGVAVAVAVAVVVVV
jgi:hypothetical protein